MNKAIALAFIALVSFTSAFRLRHTFNSEEHLEGTLLAQTYSCPSPLYRTDDWFNSFLSGFGGSSFESSQISYLQKQIPTNPRVFSSTQVLAVIKKCVSDNVVLKAAEYLNPYIQSLTPSDIGTVLAKITFSSAKLPAAKLLVNTLPDFSDSSKKGVTDLFTFQSDKDEITKAMRYASPRNCLFGVVPEKVVAFVIDTSSSMGSTFSAGGSSVSRLSFVKSELSRALQSLSSSQKFNVIGFGSSASAWKTSYVDATSDNINSAIAFINKLSAFGLTDVSSGLDSAFKTQGSLSAIYLLADGVPNFGAMTTDSFKRYVNDKNSNKSPKVRFNTISFMAGGSESSSDKSSANTYFSAAADSSYGTFRGFN